MSHSLSEKIVNFEYSQNPDIYKCLLWGFRASHSLLTVKATIGDVTRQQGTYLVFAETRYYEGPTQWTGCPIKIASQSEFNLKVEGIELSSGRISDSAYLFIFGEAMPRVNIIAHDAYEAYEPPD